MKRILYLLPASLIIAVLIFSCDKLKIGDQEITSTIRNQPHCKNHVSTKAFDGKINNSMSAIEYSYNAKKMVLSIKHINAGFNCCPGVLSCPVTVGKNSIQITETESEQGCKCLCLYDLIYEITGVPEGKYQIEIKEPYLDDQEAHVFDVNLAESPTGQHIVNRTKYPWESPSD